MWKTKVWKFKTILDADRKRDSMQQWIEKHEGKYEIKEIVVNNAWAVQYRKLKITGTDW